MPYSSAKTNHNLAVQVANVTVKYGDYVAIENISFEIKTGEIVAIIGPNGSGKSTIVKTILGLNKIEAGEIKVFGGRIDQNRHLIGYVPQKFAFEKTFPMMVGEFIAISGRKKISHNHIATLIDEVGLEHRQLNATLGSLSGGQLQRVLIAAALIHDPKILFLDEPGTGIDVVGEHTFYELLGHLNKTHNTTIVMVSHDLAVVSKLVDKVICINRDLVCVGTPEATLQSKNLAEFFGHEINFYDHKAHKTHQHTHLK